jgi:hypothetical protein
VARFHKGKSGNPGGRPKESNEVKELARQYSAEAVEKLAAWMRSDNAKASVSACNALLDRAFAPTVTTAGVDSSFAALMVTRAGA